jgi:hypothetical protein
MKFKKITTFFKRIGDKALTAGGRRHRVTGEKRKYFNFRMQLKYKANFKKRTLLNTPISKVIAYYEKRIEAINKGRQLFIEQGIATESVLNELFKPEETIDIEKDSSGTMHVHRKVKYWKETEVKSKRQREEMINAEIKRLKERVADLKKLQKAETESEFCDILHEIDEKTKKMKLKK